MKLNIALALFLAATAQASCKHKLANCKAQLSQHSAYNSITCSCHFTHCVLTYRNLSSLIQGAHRRIESIVTLVCYCYIVPFSWFLRLIGRYRTPGYPTCDTSRCIYTGWLHGQMREQRWMCRSRLLRWIEDLQFEELRNWSFYHSARCRLQPRILLR